MKKEEVLKIVKEDKEEIKRQYDLLQTSKVLAEREYSDENYTNRDVFHRDFTRILYSPSFRRLQGKMQILGVNSAAFYRNRLTHSLEVAQLARSIAYDLSKACDGKIMYYSSPNNKNDLYCLEAAALCHDIGHPAFGHSGERVLDRIAKRYGMRFEGNAQNFRVLRTLDKYDPENQGLNLTWRTLLAINKYIVKETANNGKFMFAGDYIKLMEIREKAGYLKQRTLDVQIIELADDIAYAVHDLEDALANRSFNIDELRYVMNMKRKKMKADWVKGKNVDFSDEETDKAFKIFDGIINEAKDEAFIANSYRTPQEYSQVFRKKLVSKLTHKLVKNVTYGEVSEKEAKLHGTDITKELCLGDLKPLCSILKKSIFECATRDEDIALYEKRGEIVVEALFNAFIDDKINKKNLLLPPDYRNGTDEPGKNVRGIIDFIAGMMDTFAIQKYEELFGVKFNEIPINLNGNLKGIEWEIEKLNHRLKWAESRK